jgi:serine protease Do
MYCLALIATTAQAASLTGDLQKAVRGATFEVVTPKPQQDTLKYEKPLPLELIPYTERNDKYWSIGTAFAIDNETFISAAHVFLNSIGSRLGTPALRDSSGAVYPVDRIVKFSLHQDFIVFTLKTRPALAPLTVNREPKIDDSVFAVGNALGEGIVIRDGLFTSETAEDQDGRWKWIRFSAAASPGNSGGPLLDTQGRVIGIVIGKSDNENLNYAFPIARLIDASDKLATIDTRWLQRLPYMTAATTVTWKQDFDLPKAYADFAKTYLAALATANDNAVKSFLASNSATIFPQGPGAKKLLTTVHDAHFPRLIAQRKDNAWHLQEAEDIETTDLGDEGFVRVGHAAGTGLAQVRVPGDVIDAKFYREPALSIDVALKAMRITRPVGADQVRVTSMGPALSDKVWQDAHGRRWQVRRWALDFMNSDLLALMLPMPNGYVALVDTASAGTDEINIEQLKLLANQTYVSYAGSIQQWRIFLAQKDLRPALFDTIKLDYNATRGLTYESKRFSLAIPPGALAMGEHSRLTLRTAFFIDKEKLAWDVGGLGISEDEQENTFVMATRQAKPPADADKEVEQRWDRLRSRRSPFNSLPMPDPDRKSFWIATAIGAQRGTTNEPDANSSVLYEITYSTEADLLPRDLEERQRLVLRGSRVLER